MFVRQLRSRRGLSNITEYAVLISVVAGAAITMQPYLRVRLQGGADAAATNYQAALGAALGGGGGGTFEPVRTSSSDSRTVLIMNNATDGDVTVDSASSVGQNK